MKEAKFDIEYYKLKCKHLENENFNLRSVHERVLNMLCDYNSPSPSSPSAPSSFAPMTTSTAPSSPILGQGGNRRYSKRQLAKELVDPDETFWEPTAPTVSKQEKGSNDKLFKKEDSPKKSLTPIKKRKHHETSYDRIPMKNVPKYAYKEKAVRGAKRKLLPGRACNNCEEFYKAVDVTGAMKEKCSKHRSKHERALTPIGFWDLSFPSTQELRARQAALPSPEKYA